MLRKIGGITLFALAVFLVIEISYRIYVVGPIALNPFKVNSLNVVTRSEYVQPSEYPDVFFELKPNMSGWFKGVRFATSSAGLADIEYEQQKPPDTFRVAVVGSSWTMPSGVEPEHAWHAVIEDKLAGEAVRYEVINFGVEYYGLRELVGTLRHKALNWQPDLILVAVTTFTASIRWEEPGAGEQLPDRVYPFFESYTLRAFQKSLGIAPRSSNEVRNHLAKDDYEARLEQVQRALRELDELTADNVPVVVIFLGYVPLKKQIESSVSELADSLGIELVFANRLFTDLGLTKSRYQISKFDRHPNAAGHYLIAEGLATELAARGLLPEAEF